MAQRIIIGDPIKVPLRINREMGNFVVTFTVRRKRDATFVGPVPTSLFDYPTVSIPEPEVAEAAPNAKLPEQFDAAARLALTSVFNDPKPNLVTRRIRELVGNVDAKIERASR